MSRHSDPAWTSLRSDGALSARGYATAPVPPARPSPVPDAERVVIVDPRRTATTPASQRSGARPRAPDQMQWPEPSTGIELPDDRSPLQTQRVWVDPEVIERWKAEAARETALRETGASRD